MAPPRHQQDANSSDEERPLLSRSSSFSSTHVSRPTQPPADGDSSTGTHKHEIQFSENDTNNPKNWSKRKKLTQVFIIALMAILSPLASSMFTPGISQIAEDLNTDEQSVIATSTGYVIMLGVGPLVVAPFSETFGRRRIYLFCFVIFGLLQIPTALSPNIECLIAVRTISGFFGSVGIANGGGTLNDMYNSSERASIFGWYLLGPLLGPTLGPLFGGIIVTHLNWRWIYWILAIISLLNMSVAYFFLHETYAPILLSRRKQKLQEDQIKSDGSIHTNYYFEGEDRRPLLTKLRHSMRRPLVIFIQPIVLIMSMYQALLFSTTYSIYTNFQKIFSSDPYNFNSEQVGILYLGPGLGFLTAVLFLVPQIDTVYNRLTERNKNQEMPEFRLPLANIGAVLIPVSLFAFAWTVEYRVHWIVPIIATYFYGIGQVMVFNTVQNYYIDSFSQYAASAVAGGSVFRSVAGGIVPLFAPTWFEKLGYGWGVSIFAFLAVLIAPSPVLFYYFGRRIRERYPISL